MHSWKTNGANCWSWWIGPETLGFQADMAHTLLYTMGYNAPEDRMLPEDFDWKDHDGARRGAEDVDIRAAAVDHRFPCRAKRRNGERLGLARQDGAPLPAARSQWQAGHRASSRACGCATTAANSRRAFRHICWDGCMFPNSVMMKPETWNDILRDDDCRPRRPRLDCRAADNGCATNDKKRLHIGLVGYGFMGRTHSNAYRQVNNFSIWNTARAQGGLRRGTRSERAGVCGSMGI